MVRTEVLRRACLICGRWGTPDANKAVARAIESLSFGAEPLRGTASTACLALREFGASVSFYWNMAGLLDRQDWVAVRTLQKLGSGLIDHSQNMTAAAIQIAEK